ncbi:SIR2 family NAD-dependent protein deacylase [Kushneria indalinina]|uniref:NAD-dependent protein deacylase n=1 Tax=Kushneria indalinina DSM 14324 TaxID=1122140 RepID=A0A3D9DRZ1_9GAMM|nr:Sir2 family NAD-dependent protein deacetylase [Kushneria indalinina]REC93538.1 NAD-dependent deacetylase [Kushneria indalinina DSM 14324]
MAHLVVLTGAGISAESGIKTFRDGDGLWENHHVEDVATPEGWARDPHTVLRFYNERRAQVRAARPNEAHLALAELEKHFRVSIITQNIDNLHERAGSRDVLHLHGELLKARSSRNPRLVYRLGEGETIEMGDCCDDGAQLRPHVVWFGENVPLYATACDIVAEADLLLIVGTSLAVTPASMLMDEAPIEAPRVLVDPGARELAVRGVVPLATSATEGVSRLRDFWSQHGRLLKPDPDTLLGS